MAKSRLNLQYSRQIICGICALMASGELETAIEIIPNNVHGKFVLVSSMWMAVIMQYILINATKGASWSIQPDQSNFGTLEIRHVPLNNQHYDST